MTAKTRPAECSRGGLGAASGRLVLVGSLHDQSILVGVDPNPQLVPCLEGECAVAGDLLADVDEGS